MQEFGVEAWCNIRSGLQSQYVWATCVELICCELGLFVAACSILEALQLLNQNRLSRLLVWGLQVVWLWDLDWKLDVESGSFARLRTEPYLTFQFFNHTLAERQPQPRTIRIWVHFQVSRLSCCLSPINLFCQSSKHRKQRFLDFFSHADSQIRDRNLHVCLILWFDQKGYDFNPSSAVRKFDGIHHQVLKDWAHSLTIIDDYVVRDLWFHFEV